MTEQLLLDVRALDGGYEPLQIFRKIDLQVTRARASDCLGRTVTARRRF